MENSTGMTVTDQNGVVFKKASGGIGMIIRKAMDEILHEKRS
jgi:hypothetical protein